MISKRLDCIESENLTGLVISCASGRKINPRILRLSHGTDLCDGDIYRMVRHFQKEKSQSFVDEWIKKLTDCKQEELKRLLKTKDLVKAFDTLLGFPGLWIGLELGNIRRIVAMRIQPEIIWYLSSRIEKVWSSITLHRADLGLAVDVEAVNLLQRLAPAVSSYDRDVIATAMDSGAIFKEVIDSKDRDLIKSAIMNIDCIIPSIKSMHENSKFLGVGAKAIKNLITGKSPRPSIRQALFSHWKAPNDAVIEVSEGRFRYLENSGANTWDLVYKQIWISALRGFPELTGTAPLKEKGSPTPHAEINLTKQHRFVLLVSRLGVSTSKMQAELEKNPCRETLRHCINQIQSSPCLSPTRQEEMLDHMQSTLDFDQSAQPTPNTQLALASCPESPERRWGLPFKNAHLSFQKDFFLPSFMNRGVSKHGHSSTVHFVRKDFMDAFFGSTGEFVLLSEAEPLQLQSNPPLSTFGMDVDDGSGPGTTSDYAERMSIMSVEHGELPQAKDSENVLLPCGLSELSKPDSPMGINSRYGEQIERPTALVDQVMIDPQVEENAHVTIFTDSSVLEPEVTGRDNDYSIVEEEAEPVNTILEASSATTVYHCPRSPIAIEHQTSPLKLSPVFNPAIAHSLHDEEAVSVSELQNVQNQVLPDESRRLRRSPIASINLNPAEQPISLLGQRAALAKDNTTFHRVSTMSAVPSTSTLQNVSLDVPACDAEMGSAPADEVVEQKDIRDAEPVKITFDMPPGIPEVSALGMSYDKIVDMADDFNFGKADGDMSSSFTSGNISSRKSYKFIFYNGMTLKSLALTKDEMEKYLKKRPSAVLLASNNQAGSTLSSKRQIWKTISRRQMLDQMSAEPTLTYVLTLPEKAPWWISNGSNLLKESKLQTGRKHRNGNSKLSHSAAPVAPNPWIHSHSSDSLNIISETVYPSSRELRDCEDELARSRLEQPSPWSVLKYNGPETYSLVKFDTACLGEACFQKYFEEYNRMYTVDVKSNSSPEEASAKRIVWMVKSDAMLSFKEARTHIRRVKLATKGKYGYLDIGDGRRAEKDLFESEEEEPTVEKLIEGHKKVAEFKKKRGAGEVEGDSGPTLSAMPSKMELQEPKRHLDDAGYAKVLGARADRHSEEIYAIGGYDL